MQALPAEPSFSVLNSTQSFQPLDASHVGIEVVLAGVDAALPFVGVVPRLVINGFHSWTEKKQKQIRRFCERFHLLHEKAEKAMQDNLLTQGWVETYETLLHEFIGFAAGYEKASRVWYRVTRTITTEDDQRAMAAFTERIDDLFLRLKGVGKTPDDKNDDDDDDTASSDSASTVVSSP